MLPSHAFHYVIPTYVGILHVILLLVSFNPPPPPSPIMPPSPAITDKNNQPIHEGDTLWTKLRGGKREGTADTIVTTKDEARQENVKNPPKVSSGLLSISRF